MVSTQMGHRQRRPTIILVGCMLIILLGAVATFFWQTRSELPAGAASGDVVGPPTLPAATVDSILTSMGSPMAGTGAVIEQASRQTNIDDAFALGVWWTETNDGAAGVGIADHNPGSVRGSYGYPAAFDGYTIYPSFSAGIIDWFNVLRTRYVDRGLTSAFTICYPYVGTSSSYQWAIKVVNLMVRYHGEAPPPTPIPTPSPTPIPTPDAVHIQHIQVHIVKPKPATMGLAREAHVRGNIVLPVIARPRASINAPVHSSVAPMSSTLPIILLSGLLTALLIALWGLRIGRSVVSVSNALPMPVAPEQPVAAFAAPVMTPAPTFAGPALTPLPALYVNEFSPVLVSQTESHTEQLDWSPEPKPQPVPAFSSTTEGGLLKRYVDTDVLPRKTRLRPIRMASEPVQQSPGAGNWYGPLPETPVAFTAPAASPVQEKAPELVQVGARPVGLLRRYSMEKYDGNQ